MFPRKPSWIDGTFTQSSPACAATTNGLPPIAMYANAVYYPNWRIYRQQPPSSLNYNVISHVFYAFAWVKPDGTIYLSDEWADTQIEVDGTQGCLRSFTALKRQFNFLKVIISVGGGGKGSEPFAAVARDKTLRANFARSARELVDTYGLDGIDIDWEHPSDPRQGADYILLLSDLRAHLPAPRYTLTSALPAGEWALKDINLQRASHYLDLINIMAYDFSGPWVDACGHQAQLHAPHRPHNDAARISCHSAVSYFKSRGVPPNKILLGVPAYGRSFLGAKKIGQKFSGHAGEEGTFEYRDLPRPGTEEKVDEHTGAAYCVGGDGGFITYDNPQTVVMKAKYAREQGLAGLFYWTGTGDAPGSRSLAYNGFTGLHNS